MPKWNMRNLHLLVTFKAILERGSIVAAGQDLGITQSATSKHLAQLRDWLGDPLFVRTPNGMQPTPFAQNMVTRVDRILRDADALMTAEPSVPAEFSGTFALSATDEILQRLLEPLANKLAADAPKVRLNCHPLVPDYSAPALERGDVDLVVAVNWHSPTHLKQRRVFSDQFVCVVREDNPLANRSITPQEFAAAPHLLVAPMGHRDGQVDHALRRLNLQRRVTTSIPHFSLLAPGLFARDTIVTLPSKVAEQLAEGAPLVVLPAPLKLDPVDYFALWHERFDKDPKLRWFRREVAAILCR